MDIESIFQYEICTEIQSRDRVKKSWKHGRTSYSVNKSSFELGHTQSRSECPVTLWTLASSPARAGGGSERTQRGRKGHTVRGLICPDQVRAERTTRYYGRRDGNAGLEVIRYEARKEHRGQPQWNDNFETRPGFQFSGLPDERIPTSP